MGVIFGIINMVVAIWFFASAASVKKQAIMWALIGGISFLVFKVLGYSMIGYLQGALDQSQLSDLVEQGYSQSANSARELSSETSGEQSMIAGIFYEFFPLIIALLGVSFIRAKFILGMDYVASLKHKTSMKLKVSNSMASSSINSGGLVETLTAMWDKVKKK